MDFSFFGRERASGTSAPDQSNSNQSNGQQAAPAFHIPTFAEVRASEQASGNGLNTFFRPKGLLSGQPSGSDGGNQQQRQQQQPQPQYSGHSQGFQSSRQQQYNQQTNVGVPIYDTSGPIRSTARGTTSSQQQQQQRQPPANLSPEVAASAAAAAAAISAIAKPGQYNNTNTGQHQRPQHVRPATAAYQHQHGPPMEPSTSYHHNNSGHVNNQAHMHHEQTPTQQAAKAAAAYGGTNAIVVSKRQQGNPVLKYIRNVRWVFGDIGPDYLLGANACALFLSLSIVWGILVLPRKQILAEVVPELDSAMVQSTFPLYEHKAFDSVVLGRYHLLHPKYVLYRIKELGRAYALRVLLVQIDVEDVVQALAEITKAAATNDCTLICAWSSEEAARYLETYKAYENKPATTIQEHVDADYASRLAGALTAVRAVNRTDALALGAHFGTLAHIFSADKSALSKVPGIGPTKVQNLWDAINKPFRRAAVQPHQQQQGNAIGGQGPPADTPRQQQPGPAAAATGTPAASSGTVPDTAKRKQTSNEQMENTTAVTNSREAGRGMLDLQLGGQRSGVPVQEPAAKRSRHEGDEDRDTSRQVMHMQVSDDDHDDELQGNPETSHIISRSGEDTGEDANARSGVARNAQFDNHDDRNNPDDNNSSDDEDDAEEDDGDTDDDDDDDQGDLVYQATQMISQIQAGAMVTAALDSDLDDGSDQEADADWQAEKEEI